MYTLKRVCAYYIDFLIFSSFIAPIIWINSFTNVYFVMILLILNVIPYFLISELVWHKTVGKKIMGLKIMSENGFRANKRQILLRNLVRLIDIFVFPITILLFITQKNKQRIGDIISKTIVR